MMWQNGGFSGLDLWNFVMHPVDAAVQLLIQEEIL
jgi:hypothetical protein